MGPLNVCSQKSLTNVISSSGLIILWGFGGISPTRDQIMERTGLFGIVVNTLSPFTYSFELVVRQCKPHFIDAASFLDL